MSIDEIRVPGRRLVAWFRQQPPGVAIQAFEEREFIVRQCTERDLLDPDFLSGLARVVLTQEPTRQLQILRDIKAHGIRLLDYDCRVILRPSAAGLSLITGALSRLRLPTAG